MSEERLSKLQKWILKKCLENIFFERGQAREFYGKKFSPGSIFELCCEECKKKIVKFQKNCGIEEVNRLAEELEDMT